MANKRIVHEVSSFHISNYEEIEKHIVSRTPNLGAREFEYFKYIKGYSDKGLKPGSVPMKQ